MSFTTFYQAAIAQHEVKPEKKGHSLFRPVPKERMREIQTDRPDVTENSYTVDAGHFQYETDLFKTIRNKQNGILNVQNIYNHVNLKLGLTNTTDIQVVIESFIKNIDIINNNSSKSTGFGDITLRIKQNLWGNDNGKTAFAIMPYINLPTSRFSESEVTEGGIVFPFAIELKNDWSLGTQFGMDLLKNPNDTNYHTEILYSFTANNKLATKLDSFVESSYMYNFKEKDFHLSVNGGFGFSITDNFKLDTGFNYGITKATDKVYFAGFSFRY